jgi:DNA anti-recombination protein RmuC
MGIKSWVLEWLLEDIYQNIKEVREKMATVEERLDGILATVVKVGGELKKQIADLQALIGTVTPEVQAKLDAIDASLKELDDLNPDVPE